jgi:NAD(P)H-dependent FMN reductase
MESHNKLQANLNGAQILRNTGEEIYMSKNIVILSGSPRRGGNTDLLAEAFIKGAEHAGKTRTLFRAADMKIGGCIGCCYCHAHDAACVQKDDMALVIEAMKSAYGIVYASPIYYAGFTSQLKAALDRTFALLKSVRPWTKSALLLTCGNPGASMAEPTIALYKKILGFDGSKDCGVVVATGLHEPGEIKGRPELAQAEELGGEI